MACYEIIFCSTFLAASIAKKKKGCVLSHTGVIKMHFAMQETCLEHTCPHFLVHSVAKFMIV